MDRRRKSARGLGEKGRWTSFLQGGSGAAGRLERTGIFILGGQSGDRPGAPVAASPGKLPVARPQCCSLAVLPSALPASMLPGRPGPFATPEQE